MKKFSFLLFCCLALVSCISKNEKIRTFEITGDYYFEAKTLGNRGYTWLYLCKKNSAEHIDLYGIRDFTTSSYFIDIDSININQIKGDTVIYTIVETPPGNRFCIADSLILSKGKLLSRTITRVECRDKNSKKP